MEALSLQDLLSSLRESAEPLTDRHYTLSILEGKELHYTAEAASAVERRDQEQPALPLQSH